MGWEVAVGNPGRGGSGLPGVGGHGGQIPPIPGTALGVCDQLYPPHILSQDD